MDRIGKTAKSDTARMVFAAFVVAALGIGTATAAITIGPEKTDNPAARPLTITRGVSVQPAYGPEDEDCVAVIRKTVGPNGRIIATRRIECID